MTKSRRSLLVGAAGLTALAWSWQRFGVQKVNLAFEPIPGLAGWQRAQSGGLTTIGGNAAKAVFLGIDEPPVQPLPVGQLCTTLYRPDRQGVPVAVFTDFFCPNCRVMDSMLAARDDLAITWHELPLLGPNSERVARAMIAARAQKRGLAFKTQLLTAPFRPSPQFFTAAAKAAGLELTQFTNDMQSDWVDAELSTSRAAAETLAIWGTPAMTLGETLVLGRLSSEQVDSLLADGGTCA